MNTMRFTRRTYARFYPPSHKDIRYEKYMFDVPDVSVYLRWV